MARFLQYGLGDNDRENLAYSNYVTFSHKSSGVRRWTDAYAPNSVGQGTFAFDSAVLNSPGRQAWMEALVSALLYSVRLSCVVRCPFQLVV